MRIGLLVCLLWVSASVAWAQTPPTNCANQPSGLSIIRNTPFDTIPGDNWAYNYPDFNPGAGIITDATAPRSPSNVSMQRFPTGLVGGNGGGYGSVWTNLGGPHEVTYYCVHFKVDENFEQHPVLTKIIWFQVPGNNIFLALKGGSSFNISLNWQWPDGDADNSHLGFVGSGFIDGSQTFSRGQWVEIEAIYKPSSTRTSRDGYYCSWLNGAQSACTSQLNTPDTYPSGRLKTYYANNLTVWGGTGSTKTRDSFVYFDHWRIAVGTSLGGSPPPLDTPAGPPGSVSGFTATVGGIQ